MPAMNPFTLNFYDDLLEDKYRDSQVETTRSNTRLVFSLFVVLYAAFGLLDIWLAKDFLKAFTVIRFCVVIPLFLVTLVSTNSKYFGRIHQALIILSYVFGGLGVIAMLVMIPDNITYYGGLFLIFNAGFFLLRLRYFYATTAGWLLFIVFVVSGIFWGEVRPPILLISMSLFYFSSVAIGTVGSYIVERYSRELFLQNKKIEEDNLVLEDRVTTQTLEIVKAQTITIFSLAKLVESRDKETGLHVDRVGKYCRLIAESLPAEAQNQTSLSLSNFAEVIEFASALHDIGKVGVEDEFLNKNGPLTTVEFEKIKYHTVIGSETLLNVQQRYQTNQFINMGIDITRKLVI